jgi:hypothetical protein
VTFNRHNGRNEPDYEYVHLMIDSDSEGNGYPESAIPAVKVNYDNGAHEVVVPWDQIDEYDLTHFRLDGEDLVTQWFEDHMDDTIPAHITVYQGIPAQGTHILYIGRSSGSNRGYVYDGSVRPYGGVIPRTLAGIGSGARVRRLMIEGSLTFRVLTDADKGTSNDLHIKFADGVEVTLPHYDGDEWRGTTSTVPEAELQAVWDWMDANLGEDFEIEFTEVIPLEDFRMTEIPPLGFTGYIAEDERGDVQEFGYMDSMGSTILSYSGTMFPVDLEVTVDGTPYLFQYAEDRWACDDTELRDLILSKAGLTVHIEIEKSISHTLTAGKTDMALDLIGYMAGEFGSLEIHRDSVSVTEIVSMAGGYNKAWIKTAEPVSGSLEVQTDVGIFVFHSDDGIKFDLWDQEILWETFLKDGGGNINILVV